MAKPIWRIKLVAELHAGETTEVEAARIECDPQAGLSDLEFRLAEAKQLHSFLRAEIILAQMTIADERRAPVRLAGACCPARDITPRHSARCSVTSESDSALAHLCLPDWVRNKKLCRLRPRGRDCGPEVAHVTARHAAPMPFGKVADLLSELPVS
jgi:hypothetical protein